jgi:uncharacterized protein (DUF1501 family)
MPHDTPRVDPAMLLSRRAFLGRSSTAASTAALASLFARDSRAAPMPMLPRGAVLPALHFAPKAKRVIYLFQSGGPSQIELLDPKPDLVSRHGTELPDSIRMGQRLTGMTSGQKSFPVIASKYGFKPCGESGTMISELLPHTGRIIDKLCVVRSMLTEAINHDPAITFLQTGSQQPGRASFGAWLSYGLGSEADDLPSFVVMLSQGSGDDSNQGLLERLWGAGFLPSSHQGVKLRSGGDPVLYLNDPPGVTRQLRRSMLDGLSRLHDIQRARDGDPEIASRVAQYEMAFRMQASVPELTDLSGESAATFDRYGPESKKPGTFAANCLLARRLVERGVRFVQLYHRGWDEHNKLMSNIPKQCRDVDQPQAALVEDLAARGLLDETLVVWAGEFGRTVYGQGGLIEDYGRDHHGRCFSIWLAGGGVKQGLVYGRTDDYSYNIVENPVHVHDLNATLLHLLGVDHERLTYRFQGRDYRLTDVHGKVVKNLVA